MYFLQNSCFQKCVNELLPWRHRTETCVSVGPFGTVASMPLKGAQCKYPNKRMPVFLA